MKFEYEANDFTCSPVSLYGNTQLGCHYLVGESPMGYYLYYFQPTERDAYLRAEEKTGEILNYITAKYGNEHSLNSTTNQLRQQDIRSGSRRQYSFLTIQILKMIYLRFSRTSILKPTNWLTRELRQW